MKWSFQIARIAGIEVKIHATFFLLLAWYGWEDYTRAGSAAALLGVLFILALFLCVLLHEFGHAFTARLFGIRTPDITLYPIGGVARLERIPEKPSQELLIAVAGPAVNLVIVGILFLGLSVIHAANLSILGSEGRSFAEQLMQINIFLILFNMIPSFPMDGGRVLRALLATRLSYVKATRIAARIGQGIAVLFAVYGYFYNPILIFIAMFVFMAARQELAYCEMREKISKTSVGDIMLQRFRCLPEKATVADCASLVTQDAQPAYPIVDEALGVKGIASRESLLQVLEHQRGDMPIREVMEIGVPVLKPETSLYDAVQILQQSGHSTLPVINPAGQIVGLLLFSQLIDPSKQSKNTGAA